MADNFSPDIGHRAIEADIERLSAEISIIKEKPQNRDVSGHEIVRQSVRAFVQVSPQNTTTQSDGPLPAYMKDVTPDVRLEVERLVDLAFHEGILKANEAAQAHSPFVLDAFHDALAGKLYPELQKRGLVP